MSHQSDTHSVSSGLSHTTGTNSGNSSSVPILQKATSSSVASSQPQKPPNQLVQNPFESLSGVPPTSSSSSNNHNNSVPPSHVAVRMTAPPPTMMSQPQPPQQSTPIKTASMMGTTITTSTPPIHMSSTPPPPNAATTMHNTGVFPVTMGPSQTSIPVVQYSPQPYSATHSNNNNNNIAIHSPQPPPTNTSFQNNNFPMYDHPSVPVIHSDDAARTTLQYNNNNNNNNLDYMFDDDENTVPSSLGNTTTTDDQPPHDYPNYHQSNQNNHHSNNNNSNISGNYPEFDPASLSTTIGSSSITTRIIESTKRFITSGSSDLSLDPTHRRTTTPVLTATALNHQPCLIAGYLQKLGRNQKWQTRWFETNGIDLSYYKSSKRSNLLATLDLQKVGVIEIDTDDKTEHSFRIQVLGRLYKLRANSRASCQDWVITLNRVKEARMQQGNVKLVGLPKTTALDLLNVNSPKPQQQQQHLLHNDSEHNFMDGTPRVVVVSNRERTHGVDEEEQWEQLIRIDDNNNNNNNGLSGINNHDTDIDPAAPVEAIYSGTTSGKRLSSIGTVVAARWTKHSSKIQRFRNKLSKWARSVKQYSCTGNNDAVIMTSGGRPPHHGDVVHLDKYLHPPGHDDKQRHKQQLSLASKMQSLSVGATPPPPQSSNTTSHTTPLPNNINNIPASTAISTSSSSSVGPMTSNTNHVVNKPLALNDRNVSTASDYDVRMLS